MTSKNLVPQQKAMVSKLRKKYVHGSKRSDKLVKDIRYLDGSIAKYSDAIHPLLKDLRIPPFVSEVSFVNTFYDVLKASRKKNSNA